MTLKESPEGLSAKTSEWNIVGLRVEYTDLAGRHWMTALQLRLDIAWTIDNWACKGAVVVAGTERVAELAARYIPDDRGAIDKDLYVGASPPESIN